MIGRSVSQREEHLQFLGKCTVCAVEFKADLVKVIERQGETVLVHADCSGCGTSAIIAVVAGEPGYVVTMGMLTDFTKEDVGRFSRAKSITADDVIVWHQILQAAPAPKRKGP
ncbi:hypothetical protein HYW67_02835 [Candidatus Parcubacteria bacterium]|nr:hypothetical protein [Candidatus Parcubacteria bacterium]